MLQHQLGYSSFWNKGNREYYTSKQYFVYYCNIRSSKHSLSSSTIPTIPTNTPFGSFPTILSFATSEHDMQSDLGDEDPHVTKHASRIHCCHICAKWAHVHTNVFVVAAVQFRKRLLPFNGQLLRGFRETQLSLLIKANNNQVPWTNRGNAMRIWQHFSCWAICF